jgi:glycine dehydrogenase subunit 1
MLSSPGETDADIAVGEGQSLGIPMSFGGPGFGFMACHQEYLRKMPGRIVGQTVDHQGRTGYVLTMQTREQHIRREKATSNICTNHALMALMGSIYMAAMGRQGLKDVAMLCAQKAHYALREISTKTKFVPAFTGPFFKEFVVVSPVPVEAVQDVLSKEKILGAVDIARDYPEMKDHLSFCVTEKRTRAEIDSLVRALAVLS